MVSHSGKGVSCMHSQTHWLTPYWQNVFFTELGVDPTLLMAVDLMHDLELGVTKVIIIHILRLLQAEGQSTIDEFDVQ